uniref:Succinate dehydrogenase assembly factor 3 n=1 Tax=Caenorhabditis japonica TaxID=281687 RepID=A0A8R1DFG2_CAEJA
MGDTYVKDEFKRHMTAKPEFVKPFIAEWTNYCIMLSKQLSSAGIRRGNIGKDLEPEKMEQLSNEHIQQLVELRVEADRHLGKDEFLQNLQSATENREKIL